MRYPALKPKRISTSPGQAGAGNIPAACDALGQSHGGGGDSGRWPIRLHNP